MDVKLKGRHFLSTEDWANQELETLFTLAAELKAAKKEGRPTPLLSDKTLYMIFFDASTRTRNSFETGMTQLGGHAIYLSPDKMQISHGENARDTAKVLSRYGEGIAIRHCAFGEGNAYLREVARNSDVPVLNMQCDVHPPCQILADYFTIREKFGHTRGLKLGVAWTSAPNYVRPLSVPQSLVLMMPRFGIDVTLAYPPEFRLMPEIEECDSITLDPHKGMFLPYGTGCLLVRDPENLKRAHSMDAEYLHDVRARESANFSDLSPELSRDFRGLRIWLPLVLHGAEAFRDAIEEKLMLTRWAYDQLRQDSRFEILDEPQLSVIAFRLKGKEADADARSEDLQRRVNARGRVFLSSTRLDGRYVIRLCVLSFRTHMDRVREAVETIKAEADLAGAATPDR